MSDDGFRVIPDAGDGQPAIINVETMAGRLLQLHAELYPERYPQQDHEYWSGFDPEAQTEAEYVAEHGPYEWDSGTIEWVAGTIEQILVDFDIVEAER